MRRNLIITTILIMIFSLVGCNKEESKVNLVSLNKARSTAEEAVESVKAGKYENLKVDDITPNIVGENKLYKIKLKEKDNFYDDSNKFIKEIPNIFKYVLEDGNLDSNNITYPDSGEKYNEVKEIKPTIQYEDNNKFAFFFPSLSYFWVNKGVTKQKYGGNIQNYSDLLSSNFKTVHKYTLNQEKDLSNIKYNLMDGECSIQQGIDYVENYFNTQFKYISNKKFLLNVNEVDVLQFDDNTYGYRMFYRRQYNGIPFDSIKNGAISDGTELVKSVSDMGEIILIGQKNIDFFVGIFPSQNITEINAPITKIASLETALKRASDTLTKDTEFKITNIELIYLEKKKKSYDEATPTWKFTVTNPNDNSTTYVYVNVLNGEVSTLTVQ